MPRFFTDKINNGTAFIDGSDAKHISQSLRMKVGENLTVCDLAGYDYSCVIASVSPDEIVLRIIEKTACLSEPYVKISLFQAMPKADKLESIVQKATELGVYEITPVLTSFCVSRPDEKSMNKKLVRLQKIALEAAKQSGRGIIPQIKPMLSFKQALADMKKSSLPLFFYEHAQTPLRERLAVKTENVSILIGSEGGFSDEEAAMAEKAGLFPCSLGARILRCETAPVSALACILYAFGE